MARLQFGRGFDRHSSDTGPQRKAKKEVGPAVAAHRNALGLQDGSSFARISAQHVHSTCSLSVSAGCLRDGCRLDSL